MALEIDRASREPQMPEPPRFSPQPSVAPPAESFPVPAPAPARAQSGDLVGIAAALQPLVEYCASDLAETPLRIGIIGPSGSGKSFALSWLSETIADLGLRNPGAGVTRPRDLVVATLDAAGLGGSDFDPASALASAVYVSLESGRDGANYAALADEAVHGGGDPRRAAAAAAEHQEELARRLDGERAQREELASKRARLAEALIYDTPGSRVDAMIRANRGAIDARLRRFGYAGEDMAQTFRDLLYDHASAGAGSAVGLFLRSIWAFRGQFTLLLSAVVALIAAAALDRLRLATENGMFDSFGSGFAPVGKFILDHESWLRTGVSALLAIAVVCVFINLWRATGFAALLVRGLRILNIDIRERRAELDSSVARLEKRIATLTSEAHAATERAEALSKRAGGTAPVARGPGPAFLKALHTPAKAARDFFAELGRLMLSGDGKPRPRRIFIVVDNLSALPDERALLLVDQLNALIQPGMASLVACDPARLSPSNPRLVSRDRFDIVVNLQGASAENSARLAARLVVDGGLDTSPPPAPLNPISEPLGSAESALIAAAAPLTDGGPSALRRFLNAYRLARATDAPRPLLAVMLAALQSSRPKYARAIENALAASGESFATPEGEPELRDAFAAAMGSTGSRFTKESAQAAYAAARLWCPPAPKG